MAAFQLKSANKYFFYIQFKNKAYSSYTLTNPSAYLSTAAIERRLRYNIAIDSTDLPVSAFYCNQVANYGVSIHAKSKWLNGITVTTTDSTIMSTIRSLSFVEFVQFTGLYTGTNNVARKVKSVTTDTINYGYAYAPLKQMNANYLHNSGYTGKNIKIAVLDAGFKNVNINSGFDSLRLQNRLLGTKDFTEKTANIYNSDSHGANVLSYIAGNIPGNYFGAAPHASFWLIRTEYGPTEYLCETDFWASGAEFADSVGVDIINSSLGYTTFDDSSMDFSYQDMTGTVSRASRAATLASQKGIIVCTSAGNDGNKTWHYIGSPADAKGVVSVGAATLSGEAAAFTSYGPTYDRRIKPDISAAGSYTNYINTSGTVSSGSGTSYSSPLIAGMFACMLQFAKDRLYNYSPETIIDAVYKSATLYPFPTAQLGYGIPDFQSACNSLTNSLNTAKVDSNLKVYYDKQTKQIHVKSRGDIISEIRIFNTNGTIINHYYCNSEEITFNNIVLENGLYLLKASTESGSYTVKFIVQ